MELTCAGLDWSGKPDATLRSDGSSTAELFGCAAVTFPRQQVEAVDFECGLIRRKHSMSKHQEFHAIDLTGRPAVLIDLMGVIMAYGTPYALVFNKKELAKSATVTNNPVALTSALALAALRMAVDTAPVHQIWCDTELDAKAAQDEFNTRLHHVQHIRWGMVQKGPQVKHRRSDKSNLIQLADVAVYILQRYLRGLSLDAELKTRAKSMLKIETVRWGESGDLQSYLT